MITVSPDSTNIPIGSMVYLQTFTIHWSQNVGKHSSPMEHLGYENKKKTSAFDTKNILQVTKRLKGRSSPTFTEEAGTQGHPPSAIKAILRDD